VRHVIADEIEEAGHLVMSAGSGAAALEILAANPTIDLVLADYCMPDMTGAELIKKIQSRWPHIKVALLTGYAEILALNPDDWSQGPQACPIIAKGTRMEDMLLGIEAAARGESRPLTQNATSARIVRLFAELSTRPAIEGIQRQLQSVYEKTLAEALPKPLSRLIDRLSETGSESRK
jgi:CheY-like chemotaxis protein